MRLPSILLAATFCMSTSAWADGIDGDWCSEEGGQRISIRGPVIITPGGTKMQGDYSRHSFSYVTPSQEPEAGQKVDMLLLNERNVQVRISGNATAARVWLRCSGTTS